MVQMALLFVGFTLLILLLLLLATIYYVPKALAEGADADESDTAPPGHTH